MQVARYHRSQEENTRRRTHNLCLYFGGSGHVISNCPVCAYVRTCSSVSTIQPPASMPNVAHTDVVISTPVSSTTAKALIDSRAEGNFMSLSLLTSLRLNRLRNKHSMHILNILGKPLGRGWIGYHSPVISLNIGTFHSEEISFWVLEGSTSDLVLGRPWLLQDRPLVD